MTGIVRIAERGIQGLQRQSRLIKIRTEII